MLKNRLHLGTPLPHYINSYYYNSTYFPNHKSIWRMNTSMLSNPKPTDWSHSTTLTSNRLLGQPQYLKSQIWITCREQGKIQAKKCREGIINLTNWIKKLQSLLSPNIPNQARKLWWRKHKVTYSSLISCAALAVALKSNNRQRILRYKFCVTVINLM